MIDFSSYSSFTFTGAIRIPRLFQELLPLITSLSTITMAAWTVAARQAASLTRLSSSTTAPSSQAAKLIQRRSLSGGGGQHGPPKVNIWEDPLSPSKWKEEHFVIASLTGWGVLIYGGYKFFTGGKKEQPKQKEGSK